MRPVLRILLMKCIRLLNGEDTFSSYTTSPGAECFVFLALWISPRGGLSSGDLYSATGLLLWVKTYVTHQTEWISWRN